MSDLVRTTVDFPRSRHAQLRAWCLDTAVDLGVTRVTSQDVVNLLVDRLLTDDKFAQSVRKQLAK